jgi:hypothetical protein
MLRLPLGINRSRSSLVETELRPILAELNRIWAQAGICFEARDIRHGFGARQRLVLWFVAGDEPFASGYYENDALIWTEDAPKLRRAPHRAALAPARTGAHELGHALGLRHLPRSGEWIDGLMNTGYDGFAFAPFEIRAARTKAAEYALGSVRERCLEPWL